MEYIPDGKKAVVSDARLIEDARTNAAAFAELYRRHYDRIFRYCAHRLFERHIAEDVTSMVFIKVIENLKSFTGDEIDFQKWLDRIATNCINTYLRNETRYNKLLKKSFEDDASGNNCRSNLDGDEKVEMIKGAILLLKPKYQTVIALHFFEGLSFEEIAGILGARVSTIRSRLSRALKKLRKRLSKAFKDVGQGGS